MKLKLSTANTPQAGQGSDSKTKECYLRIKSYPVMTPTNEYFNYITGEYERLYNREFLISKMGGAWVLSGLYERERPGDSSLTFIHYLYDDEGNSIQFKTLEAAKEWIKGRNGKHIKFCNDSF